MGFLSREQILKAGRKVEVVEVPEWPGPDGQPGRVHVAEPNAVLRQKMDGYSALLYVGKADGLELYRELYVDVAMACCQTPDGAPLFLDENRPLLLTASGRALKRIYDAASGLAELIKEAEAVEAAKKGFTSAPDGSSSS